MKSNVSGGDPQRAYYNNFQNLYTMQIPGYANAGGHVQSLSYGDYTSNSKIFANNTSTYYWYSYGEGNSTLYTGQPVNIGQYYTSASDNASGSIHFQGTEYVDNSFAPYILTIKELKATPGSTMREYNYDYYAKYVNYGYGSTATGTTSGSWISTTNGWRYKWAVVKLPPKSYSGNRTWMGYMHMNLTIQNTGWTNWSSTSGTSWNFRTYGPTLALSVNDYSYSSDHWRVEILIPYMGDPLNGGIKTNTFNNFTTTGTKYTYAQLHKQS